MVPSQYQQAIYDWLRGAKAKEVLVVEAVAGSGKSTTLLGGLKVLLSLPNPTGWPSVFLAFNRKIVSEFEAKTKAAGVEFRISTFNAMGNAFLRADPAYRRAQLDDKKYFWIAQDHFVATYKLSKSLAKTLASKAAKAADLIQNTLFDLHAQGAQAAFERLLLRFEIDPSVEFTEGDKKRVVSVELADMKAILARGMADKSRITFAEQIYLPASGKAGVVTPHAWVMVDEAQDLNAARLELVAKMLREGGRAVFVGDSFQAIYGFTGADTRSMQTIRDRFGATTLPLSICYRCPPDHIELVRAWPQGLGADIHPVPGRTHGALEWMVGTTGLVESVRPGDLVICRKTAPLVQAFLALIKARIPARVEGQGLADHYADMAEEVLKQCQAPEWRAVVPQVELVKCLAEWERQKTERLKARYGARSSLFQEEQKRLADEVSVLSVLWSFHLEGGGLEQVGDFRGTLGRLFSEEEGQAKVVRLSSVHRAKGLEAENVYWLGPNDHRITKADPEAAQQERNLEYVALTRSKRRLVLVGEPNPHDILHDHRRRKAQPPTDPDATAQMRALLQTRPAPPDADFALALTHAQRLVREQGPALDLTRVDWSSVLSGLTPPPTSPGSVAASVAASVGTSPGSFSSAPSSPPGFLPPLDEPDDEEEDGSDDEDDDEDSDGADDEDSDGADEEDSDGADEEDSDGADEAQDDGDGAVLQALGSRAGLIEEDGELGMPLERFYVPEEVSQARAALRGQRFYNPIRKLAASAFKGPDALWWTTQLTYLHVSTQLHSLDVQYVRSAPTPQERQERQRKLDERIARAQHTLDVLAAAKARGFVPRQLPRSNGQNVYVLLNDKQRVLTQAQAHSLAPAPPATLPSPPPAARRIELTVQDLDPFLKHQQAPKPRREPDEFDTPKPKRDDPKRGVPNFNLDVAEDHEHEREPDEDPTWDEAAGIFEAVVQGVIQRRGQPERVRSVAKTIETSSVERIAHILRLLHAQAGL
jgi:DNA helicase-2/ATP-dependent DNA helicase PcrA